VINELRIYTLQPGQMPRYLELARTVGRPARGNNYGVNHGYWTAEFGAINQIWHLWSYDSLNDRDRLRGELQKNEAWVKDYVPQIRPLIQRQDLRLMKPLREMAFPKTEGNIYEFRIYRTHMGEAKPWADLFQSYLPAREAYSPIVGLWMGEVPQPNELVHLWAYPDLNARAKARAASTQDPKWQEFLGKSARHLVEMQSVIVLPTAYSVAK